LADDLRSDYDFIWLGTTAGPERAVVEEAGVTFVAISGGKWRRYFSWANLAAPFLTFWGLLQAWRLFGRWQPSLFISAGSFISVPAAGAAWLRRVPILIHQLDPEPGLANKMMAPLAVRITTTFKDSLKYFGVKAVWVGSPIRTKLLRRTEPAISKTGKPTVLVLGGGTGAAGINRLIIDNLYHLTELARIVHLTGQGKAKEVVNKNYEQKEFLSQAEMAKRYAEAEVVICRGGLGTLSELSFLHKAAIILPLPNSHQEANARLLKAADAAVVLAEDKIGALDLYRELKVLLKDDQRRQVLGNNLATCLPTNANEKMKEIIKNIITNS